MSDIIAIGAADEAQSKNHHDEVTPRQADSTSTIASQCPLVSFSKSICQTQITGFCTHLTHADNNTFVVDSFAPAIYKVDIKGELKRHVVVDSSLSVMGVAASKDYLYVQYMDVTEYQRSVYVYTTKDGDFVKKWGTPNLLGSSIALVDGLLIIASRDKLMICSPTGKHIKDIPVLPRCVKTLCTVGTDCVALCSTSANLVMKYNLELEEICWKSYDIPSPVCTAADTFGRIYTLVQPSVLYVMDGKSG